MPRLDDHPVPSGPLAVRWHAIELPEIEAGTRVHARAELANAGSAPWHGLNLSYHWLDERGNPIVWDGIRTPVAADPNERVTLTVPIRAPIPPGEYRLALDLVDEHRFWLAELENFSPQLTVDVKPRDASNARAYVPNGIDVAPDWEERVYVTHTEGYAAVGGSIAYESGRLRRSTPEELVPYEPGGGRKPAFPHPLLCPSLVPPLEPNAEVFGLPAWRPEGDEPWIYDARIVLTLKPRPRSRRRRA